MRNSPLLLSSGGLLVSGLIFVSGALAYMLLLAGSMAGFASFGLLSVAILKAVGVPMPALVKPMRSGRLALAGVALGVVAALLLAGVVEWLLKTVGLLCIITALALFALWVFYALRARSSQPSAQRLHS